MHCLCTLTMSPPISTTTVSQTGVRALKWMLAVVFRCGHPGDRGPCYFARSILWPLFHYHPGEISFEEEDWEAYVKANVAFANAICEIVRDGDLVWVQDYHLMLLPALLRERLAAAKMSVKIGFFLHTPFPSSEIYRWGIYACIQLGAHDAAIVARSDVVPAIQTESSR